LNGAQPVSESRIGSTPMKSGKSSDWTSFPASIAQSCQLLKARKPQACLMIKWNTATTRTEIQVMRQCLGPSIDHDELGIHRVDLIGDDADHAW